MTVADDPITATALDAWRRLRDAHAEGDFSDYLDLITDDYVFSMPLGEFRGRHQGREAAAECYRQIASFEPCLRFHDPLRVTRQGDTVVIEFEDEGTIMGKPCYNRIASSFDVRGDRICGYREYFGDIDPALTAAITGK